MSGHSHWSGIKHKKGAIDAKRGKLFSKLAKYITTAARRSGGDPDSNLKLRYALDKARAASMPKDTIERAVKKGTGELGGAVPDELIYEGYAAGGVAVLVDVLTDNRNRTAGEIRKMFELRGGALAGAGSVAWMFERKGFIAVNAEGVDEEKLMELALDAGAEDMVRSGEQFEITSKVEDFESVRQALTKAGIAMEVAELTQIPKNTVPVTEQTIAKRILDLMNELEDHEDVQGVHANFDIPDELLQKLSESE